MKTAIIRAGMAGLTAARLLNIASCEVTVLDKSKGTGGRLYRLSYQGGWINHGAPYFSVGLDLCYGFLRDQLPSGNLQRWRPRVAGPLRGDECSHAIGVPRNSADLAAGILEQFSGD